MIASEFMLGATKVTIHDDKCVSKEEAEEILKNIAKIVQPSLVQKELRKRESILGYQIKKYL